MLCRHDAGRVLRGGVVQRHLHQRKGGKWGAGSAGVAVSPNFMCHAVLCTGLLTSMDLFDCTFLIQGSNGLLPGRKGKRWKGWKRWRRKADRIIENCPLFIQKRCKLARPRRIRFGRKCLVALDTADLVPRCRAAIKAVTKFPLTPTKGEWLIL